MRILMRAAACGASLVTIACHDVVDSPTQFLDIPADAAVAAAGPATEIFFTEAGTGRLWRVTMDLSGTVTSATPIIQRSNPVGIALDAVSGKMWWTDATTNTIERALSSPPYTADPPVLSGLSTPVGIAVSPGTEKVYWVEESAKTIHRANLVNGSADTTLVSGLGDPRYIVLDGLGKMYWSDAGLDRIERANVDGTKRKTLVSGQPGPYGLAIDKLNRALYWNDNTLQTIQRGTTAGGVESPFINNIAAVGIALDIASGKIYWAANGDGKIQRANLDGSGIENLVTGLVNPHGIALRSGIPTTQVCSLIATGPDVWVRFTSNGGAHNDDTHWYATLFGVAQQFLFNNGTGIPGTEIKISHTFTAGDEVFIAMLDNTATGKYWTGAGSRNPDSMLHFRGTPISGDPKYQIRGGFEETSGGGDLDYDDLVMDIGGVKCN